MSFVSARRAQSRVVWADGDTTVSRILDTERSGAVIARGGGRNYGDAADNSAGSVVLLDSDTEWDLDDRGLLTVGAGTTLGFILERVHPHGWTLPVVPATRHVTVGGAIASDVHGKNHLTHGSFGAHVRSLTVVTPTGEHEVTAASDPDLLAATCGGMGLTGVVTRASIQLHRAESSWLMASHHTCDSLEDVMAVMLDVNSSFRIAWLDAFATGGQLGRGYVVGARWANPDELVGRARRAPGEVTWTSYGTVPHRGVPRLLHDPTLRAMNRTWHSRSRRHPGERPLRLDRVLMPLDAVEGWNRLYGRKGFLQYQFLVPDESVGFIGECLARLSRAGCFSYFTTMKRLGAASGSFLSFARPGWSLSLDFPATTRGLCDLLDDLDEELVAVGGRIYLAKDSRMHHRHVPAMYPLDAFRSVKTRVDPDGVLQSDLSRRLLLADIDDVSSDV